MYVTSKEKKRKKKKGEKKDRVQAEIKYRSLCSEKSFDVSPEKWRASNELAVAVSWSGVDMQQGTLKWRTMDG